MEKLIITAAICGAEVTKAQNPAVPYTVEEMVREAKSAYAAGAAILHIHVREDDGTKRYDFQYTDRYGYTNTIGGISRLFNEECWNYAKLISGVLRHGMPIEKTVSLIESLHLDSESINTWKTGVCRALKQYIVDGTKSKGKCPSCGQENMAYQNGCLTCMSCGYSKCG